jgi:hypothetical protein
MLDPISFIFVFLYATPVLIAIDKFDLLLALKLFLLLLLPVILEIQINNLTNNYQFQWIVWLVEMYFLYKKLISIEKNHDV